MQTFVPVPGTYLDSVSTLDWMRLGKQRVETMQIMNALVDPKYGWQNHTAVRMWRGYECQLFDYQVAVCQEWTGRGCMDTCLDKTYKLHVQFCKSVPDPKATSYPYPDWWGDPQVHVSHRGMLFDKAVQYGLHHTDQPHRPHDKCNGKDPHKPHKACNPNWLIDWYRPKFPEVVATVLSSDPLAPPAIPYVWPSGRNA